MSAVTKFFFRAPYPSQNTWSIIRWWESRRLAYNLAVGAAGVASLAFAALVEVFSPAPIVDFMICRRWGENYSPVGLTLFRYGFAFAVGLSLIPIPFALVAWGVRVLGLFL